MSRILLILYCSAMWALLFSLIGSITHREMAGAIAGAVIGTIVGYGFTKQQLGTVVVWTSVFALLGSFLGPACDADALSSALWFAGIGLLCGLACDWVMSRQISSEKLQNSRSDMKSRADWERDNII